MVKQTSVQLANSQRKWQINQQRALNQSRMKQQSIRSRTSSDYRHKRMP
ncbi:hypothetical protein [Motiliproteus sp. MSK22-1]|nr:hypothetical protein [Motiliproteus sp. MSK22-1]